jgi:hypothetical protein
MRNVLRLLVILAGLSSVGFGQTAVPSGLPKVVATFQSLNQTGTIQIHTLFTPPEEGLYRVTVVMIVTVGNGQQDSDWQLTLSWTDENGREGYILPVDTQSPTSQATTIPIHDLRGIPIDGGVISTGQTSGSKYDVFVVIEQIA